MVCTSATFSSDITKHTTPASYRQRSTLHSDSADSELGQTCAEVPVPVRFVDLLVPVPDIPPRVSGSGGFPEGDCD